MDTSTAPERGGIASRKDDETFSPRLPRCAEHRRRPLPDGENRHPSGVSHGERNLRELERGPDGALRVGGLERRPIKDGKQIEGVRVHPDVVF
jgi:hypothetical protein